MKNKKINLKDVEVLSETSNGTLVGGFSLATASASSIASYYEKNVQCTVTNNCDGGNCRSGCGSL